MFKLLFLSAILLDLSGKEVLGLECRHAVSLHIARSNESLLKREDSITCENKDQSCARVHVKGIIGKNRASLRAASCMNKTLCHKEDLCSIENLLDMTRAGQFTKVRSCTTKCCNEDHCNTHNNAPPPERLTCLRGMRVQNAEGKVIRDEMVPATCRHSAEGSSRQSRCFFAEFLSTRLQSNSIKRTTVGYCVFKSMCEDKYCEELGMKLSLGGEYSLGDCNITCCSTPYCNAAVSMVLSPAIILCAFLASYFLT